MNRREFLHLKKDNLFAILQTLKKEGITIILITHKLKEIMSITDNVTVMRKGITIKSLKLLLWVVIKSILILAEIS